MTVLTPGQVMYRRIKIGRSNRAGQFENAADRDRNVIGVNFVTPSLSCHLHSSYRSKLDGSRAGREVGSCPV